LRLSACSWCFVLLLKCSLNFLWLIFFFFMHTAGSILWEIVTFSPDEGSSSILVWYKKRRLRSYLFTSGYIQIEGELSHIFFFAWDTGDICRKPETSFEHLFFTIFVLVLWVQNNSGFMSLIKKFLMHFAFFLWHDEPTTNLSSTWLCLSYLYYDIIYN
jgi:hypothetical protein